MDKAETDSFSAAESVDRCALLVVDMVLVALGVALDCGGADSMCARFIDAERRVDAVAAVAATAASL